jgi:formylglycine-generating enzyme required for sulfatase activity
MKNYYRPIALIGSMMALLISPSFAYANFLSYGANSGDFPPDWLLTFGTSFPILHEFGVTFEVYHAYGKIYALCMLLTIPMLTVVLKNGEAKEKGPFGANLVWIGAFFVSLGILVENWLNRGSFLASSGYALGFFGLAILWIGALIIGFANRKGKEDVNGLRKYFLAIPTIGIFGLVIFNHFLTGSLLGYFFLLFFVSLPKSKMRSAILPVARTLRLNEIPVPSTRYVVITVLVVTLLSLGFGKIPALLPLTSAELEQIREGVQSNEDWEVISRQRFGAEMLVVPSGCFQMGSTVDQLTEDVNACREHFGRSGCQQRLNYETPAHNVCFENAFWIDRLPVTNWQYLLNTRKAWDSPYSSLRLPLQGINWHEADNYCQTRGARLPTEAEWEYVARGPDNLLYPYGNVYDAHTSTLRHLSPPQVGETPEGGSWIGAQDMSGGMAEWVNDWFGEYPSSVVMDPTGPETGDRKITRGGSWFSYQAFFLRTALREPQLPNYSTSIVGFRCAADFTEP